MIQWQEHFDEGVTDWRTDEDSSWSYLVAAKKNCDTEVSLCALAHHNCRAVVFKAIITKGHHTPKSFQWEYGYIWYIWYLQMSLPQRIRHFCDAYMLTQVLHNAQSI